MLEPEIVVYSRKKDTSIVAHAAEGAKAQYKEISGRDVSITVQGTLSDDRYDFIVITIPPCIESAFSYEVLVESVFSAGMAVLALITLWMRDFDSLRIEYVLFSLLDAFLYLFCSDAA